MEFFSFLSSVAVDDVTIALHHSSTQHQKLPELYIIVFIFLQLIFVIFFVMFLFLEIFFANYHRRWWALNSMWSTGGTGAAIKHSERLHSIFRPPNCRNPIGPEVFAYWTFTTTMTSSNERKPAKTHDEYWDLMVEPRATVFDKYIVDGRSYALCGLPGKTKSTSVHRFQSIKSCFSPRLFAYSILLIVFEVFLIIIFFEF